MARLAKGFAFIFFLLIFSTSLFSAQLKEVVSKTTKQGYQYSFIFDAPVDYKKSQLGYPDRLILDFYQLKKAVKLAPPDLDQKNCSSAAFSMASRSTF